MSTDDITCGALVDAITDFLEGTMPVQERAVVERHLAICSWCETYLAQMRHTLTVVGQLREDDVPAPVLDALARAFRTEHAQQHDA